MAEGLDVMSARTFRRLVIDLDALQVAFDLHPALTVVATTGSRAATVVDLFATARDGAQAGVHLEYVDEFGRTVLAFRPYGAAHVRLDLDTGATLGDVGSSCASAVATRPNHGAEVAGQHGDNALRHLGTLAQVPLWHAAERLHRAEAERDARFVDMSATEACNAAQPPPRWRNRVARQRLRALADALAELDAAENHWRSLVGDIAVRDALAMRPLVESIAEVRDTTRSVLAVSRPPGDEAVQRGRRKKWAAAGAAVEPDLTDSAADVVADALRRPDRPLILSLTATEVDAAEAVTVLDVLAGLAAAGQVIVVSDHDEVADWGQLESVTSRASFLDLRPRDS